MSTVSMDGGEQDARSAPVRIVVAISGSGTNLQALLDAQPFSSSTPGTIVHVVSNRKAAYGLTRAAAYNPPVPTSVFAMQPYLKNNTEKTRKDYDVELANLILAEKPDLLVLAGFMHILSATFLNILEGVRILNLHPSLPGLFPGANAIERAYEAFQKKELPENKTGLMVHEVVEEIDAGAPIVIEEFFIKDGETLEEVQDRFHRLEHIAIVKGVAKVVTEIATSRFKTETN